METRKRGLDECRLVEAKGGSLQSKIRVEQGSKVVVTYLAGTGKAVSCLGEVGRTCVQMVEKL